MKTTTTPDGFTTWHFSRAELIALLAHASTDATRFGIFGIGLDVPQGAATATDGPRAAKVWGERVNYDCAVVPAHTLVLGRDSIELLIKSARKDDEIMITTRKADEPALMQAGPNGAVISARLVDAGHPPVDQVMPQYGPKHTGVAAGVNPDYLADLALVTRACPPVVRDLPRGKKERRYPGLVLFPPTKERDPFLARVSCPQNATEWAVAIMPMLI